MPKAGVNARFLAEAALHAEDVDSLIVCGKLVDAGRKANRSSHRHRRYFDVPITHYSRANRTLQPRRLFHLELRAGPQIQIKGEVLHSTAQFALQFWHERSLLSVETSGT